MSEQANFKRDSKIVFKEEGDVGLLFNPETGKINILNETGKAVWMSLDGQKTKADIIKEICLAYEVEEEKKVEKDVDSFIISLGKFGFLENNIGFRKFPVSVCLAITSICNLNCKHCLNRNLPSTEKDLTTDEILKIIDQLGVGGTKSISLFGGEPLCCKDFKIIVERINKYPISISLNTNATLIDKKIAKWLKAHKVTGAVVSFDGSSPEVMEKMRGANTFQKCIAGIRTLREEGLSVLLSATLTKLNYKDIRSMVLFAKQINGSSIRFNHVFFSGNAACFMDELRLSPDEEKEAIEAIYNLKEEFGDFINASSSYLGQKKKLDKVNSYIPRQDKLTVNPCGAAGSKCAIRPDGWVTPCEIMWEVKCGNLKEKTLSDIWENSEIMNSFRKPLELNLDTIPECKGCNYQYLCFLGHRCYPYYNAGGVANRKLYCWRKVDFDKNK